jgi:Pyruvate/2-oxoacid:ferredoxin oxidoreductase delta subunit
MTDEIYKGLMNRFTKQGGRYPGMDIPEFYEMVIELFSPEEASVATAMPKGAFRSEQLAQVLDRSKEEVESTLQTMASKGLCIAVNIGETEIYTLPPFVPGIFEFQFMRGTRTERDLRLAKLIHNYKEAVDAVNGIPKISFPPTRVITVDEKIEAGNQIHTYDQIATYVESSDSISVATCFCRHEAQLIDENDSCGKPNEVCMQFGIAARFAIGQGMGREISKKEAIEILKRSEEAGLVHCSVNRQNLDFVCNCCKDHCMILQTALAQPKPGLALNSGFRPNIDQEECNSCEACIDNCPSMALAMSEDDILELNVDRCFGCGVCATSCTTDAIAMIAKPGYPEPPLDEDALKQALRTATMTQ